MRFSTISNHGNQEPNPTTQTQSLGKSDFVSICCVLGSLQSWHVMTEEVPIRTCQNVKMQKNVMHIAMWSKLLCDCAYPIFQFPYISIGSSSPNMFVESCPCHFMLPAVVGTSHWPCAPQSKSKLGPPRHPQRPTNLHHGHTQNQWQGQDPTPILPESQSETPAEMTRRSAFQTFNTPTNNRHLLPEEKTPVFWLTKNVGIPWMRSVSERTWLLVGPATCQGSWIPRCPAPGMES